MTLNGVRDSIFYSRHRIGDAWMSRFSSVSSTASDREFSPAPYVKRPFSLGKAYQVADRDELLALIRRFARLLADIGEIGCRRRRLIGDIGFVVVHSELAHGDCAELRDVADTLDQPSRVLIHRERKHQMVGTERGVIQAPRDLARTIHAV